MIYDPEIAEQLERTNRSVRKANAHYHRDRKGVTRLPRNDYERAWGEAFNTLVGIGALRPELLREPHDRLYRAFIKAANGHGVEILAEAQSK